MQSGKAPSQKHGNRKASPVSLLLVVLAYAAVPIWLMVEMLIECINISKLDENKSIGCRIDSDGKTVIDSCDDTEVSGLNKRALWASVAMVAFWIVLSLVALVLKKKKIGDKRRKLSLYGNNALVEVFEAALTVWIAVWFFFIDIDGRRYLYSHCVARIGWYKAAAWIHFGGMFMLFFTFFKTQWAAINEKEEEDVAPTVIQTTREVEYGMRGGLDDVTIQKNQAKDAKCCSKETLRSERYVKAFFSDIPMVLSAVIIIALKQSAGENFFESGLALVGALLPLLALLKTTAEATWSIFLTKSIPRDAAVELNLVPHVPKPKFCNYCQEVFDTDDLHCPKMECDGSLQDYHGPIDKNGMAYDSSAYAPTPATTPYFGTEPYYQQPTYYEPSTVSYQ